MLTNTLHCRVLTTAFAQALRDHVADHERPLAALASVARSIAELLTEGREQAAAVAAPAFDELAVALRAAVEALWVEYGGDPHQMPVACVASH